MHRPGCCEPVVRIYGDSIKLLNSVSSQLVLFADSAIDLDEEVTLTPYVQHRVDEDVNTVGLSHRNGMHELIFGAPACGNGSFLIKLAEIPLKIA